MALDELHELHCMICGGIMGYTAGVPDGACAFYCRPCASIEVSQRYSPEILKHGS